MMAGLSFRVLVGVLAVGFVPHSIQGQQPVIEYSSLLSGIDVTPADHTLEFASGAPVYAAYLSPDAKVTAVLSKLGDETPLFTQAFRTRSLTAPFSLLTVMGTKPYKFEQPGDYQLVFYADKKPISQLNFAVSLRKSQNAELLSLSGPWEQWAYLWFPAGKRGDGQPEFRLWRSLDAANANTDAVEYRIEIKKDGEIVAVANNGSMNPRGKSQLKFPLKQPRNADAPPFLAKEFLASDGQYHVIVKQDEKLDAVYPFEVRLGEFVFPKQQTNGYRPAIDYILPRIPDAPSKKAGGGDTLWMQRLSDADAVKITRLQKPAIEYSSLLSSLDVVSKTRQLVWDTNHPLAAVFLPKDAFVEAVISKADSSSPLHRQSFRATPLYEPFSLLAPATGSTFRFEEAGEYQLTFLVNNKPTTRLKFSIAMLKSDDMFNPVRFAFTNEPWAREACLWLPLPGQVDAPPEVRLWRNHKTLQEKPEPLNYAVELRKDGETVASSGPIPLRTHKQTEFKFPLRQVFGAQGSPFLASELLARDGLYHVVVTKDGQLDAVYPLTIKNGKPEFPKQQTLGYEPHEDFIVPRFPGTTIVKTGAGDVLWMTKLPDAEATAIFKASAGEIAKPSVEQLANWNPKRSDDAKQAFDLKTTTFEIHETSPLSAGNDVIAFATQSPAGIRYFQVGEEEVHDLPDGESYSSEVIHVAGEKIVLVKQNQVVIYDTKAKQARAIPADVISLNIAGEMPLSRTLAVDGYLVATVNNPNNVADGGIVKVIDISSEEPQILPFKNSAYAAGDISAITVDAKTGLLAVACPRKMAIFVAGIAAGARQQGISLSQTNGINEQPIRISDSQVVYADIQARMRSVNIADRSVELIPARSPVRSFAVAVDTLAVATNVPQNAARYQYWVGKRSQAFQPATNQGLPIDGTPGFGIGGSAAVAEDGTAFIAGAGSFKPGDILQARKDREWTAIRSPNGQLITAIDIAQGRSLIAFKTKDASGKTVVGYATYGESITLPNSAPASPGAGQRPVVAPTPIRPKRLPNPIAANQPLPPNQKSGSGFWMILSAIVALAAVGGFFVYQKKKQS